MKDIDKFYILGLPIETEIGICNFLKVKEYPDYFMDLQVLGMTKNHVISEYTKVNKDGNLDELIEELYRVELPEIVFGIPEIKESYIRIFSKVFNNEDAFGLLTDQNFSYFRLLIMTMNGMKEEAVNPNPEIQKAIERSKRVKGREGDKFEFADMVTSIVGFNGLTYDAINEFSIYQLYMTFYRISQIKNYDTSTLFATVSTEKIDIESWSKHINMFEEDKHSISHDKFKKTTGSIVSE